jgi:membrane protein implicated in regulation of membrane protease activity
MMSDSLIWLLAGIGLLILEVALPGVFLMWLGLAAIGTGLILQAVSPGFETQVVAFAVLAAISIGIGLRLRRRGRAPGAKSINTQEAGLAGRAATALSFEGREGRVRVGDSDWPARLASGSAPPNPGDRMRVVGVDGTVVIVQADGGAS